MSNDYRILNVNEKLSFKKKIDAINWCTGKNYGDITWQQACWPSNKTKNDFRIWFPKLSDKLGSEYIPTSDGFKNYLSEDWNYFYFDDANEGKAHTNPNDAYSGVDVIFAKESGGDYVFRGAYKIDLDESLPKHFVHRRIATSIKLIGSPVQGYELLDKMGNNIVGDINTPITPQKIYINNEGVLRYICSRCNTDFEKSPRCPECGQLVKE